MSDQRPHRINIVPKHENTQAFQESQSVDEMQLGLTPLLANGKRCWLMDETGAALERGFKFKTFEIALKFMNNIATECTEQEHYPEWSNSCNKVFIRWTTHSPPGVSPKDVHMAKYCDKQAALIGELEVDEGEADLLGDQGKDLLKRAANCEDLGEEDFKDLSKLRGSDYLYSSKDW
ncbi:MAG: putative pterin-4-alpha-carbinolamine dehydratase [Cirrosporium novae-zelandiae]|nr:MAG: putative pterin-4-alpha-carbinolamine dehydratase [Cirrosporium novae-zelandiae]